MAWTERDEARAACRMLQRLAEERAKADPYEERRRTLLGLARGVVRDPEAFVDEILPRRKPVKITKPMSFFLPKQA